MSILLKLWLIEFLILYSTVATVGHTMMLLIYGTYHCIIHNVPIWYIGLRVGRFILQSIIVLKYLSASSNDYIAIPWKINPNFKYFHSA